MFKFIQKLRARYAVKLLNRDQVHEIADLLSQLAWLETREATIHFTETDVRVEVFEWYEGKRGRFRGRRAEGSGDFLVDAIKDVAETMRQQDRISAEAA